MVLNNEFLVVAAVMRLGRGVVVVVVVVAAVVTGAVVVDLGIELSLLGSCPFFCKSIKSYFLVLHGTLRAKSHESAAGLKYRPEGQVN